MKNLTDQMILHSQPQAEHTVGEKRTIMQNNLTSTK